MWSANVSVQNPAKCPRCVSTSDHHQHCRGDAPGVTVWQCSVGTLSQCSRHILLRKGNMSYLYYLLIVRGGGCAVSTVQVTPWWPPSPTLHCTGDQVPAAGQMTWCKLPPPAPASVWLIQRPSWLIDWCTFRRAKSSHGKIEKIK